MATLPTDVLEAVDGMRQFGYPLWADILMRESRLAREHPQISTLVQRIADLERDLHEVMRQRDDLQAKQGKGA